MRVNTIILQNFCQALKGIKTTRIVLGFYPRDAMLARVLAVNAFQSVCLSVCPTVISCWSWHYAKTPKRRITQTTLCMIDSPGILVFWRQQSVVGRCGNISAVYLCLCSYSNPLVRAREGTCKIFSKRQRITLRLLNAIAIPSIVCLSSVVCDVGAPYSGGWTFRQFFFTIR